MAQLDYIHDPHPLMSKISTARNAALKLCLVVFLTGSSFYSSAVLANGSQAARALLGVTSPDEKKKAVEEIAKAGSQADHRALIAYALQNPSSKETTEIATILLQEGNTRAVQSAVEIGAQTQSQEAREGIAKAVYTALETHSASWSVQQRAVIQQGLRSLYDRFALKEDLGNGSRFLIQPYLLKRALESRGQPDTRRIQVFDQTLSEIDAFLKARPVQLHLKTEKELETFLSSLQSSYTGLKDEMELGKGLSAHQPVRLTWDASLSSKMNELHRAFRKFDRDFTGTGSGYLFDYLSHSGTAGQLSRLGLMQLSGGEKITQLNAAHQLFETEHAKLKNIATTMIASGQVKFNDPVEQRFFELLLTNYFSQFSLEESHDIIKAIIERPDRTTGNDLFRLLVLHAGPQMQKLLQILGRRDGFSKEVSRIFQLVEESGLQSPWQRMAQKFVLPPKGYTWVSLDQDAKVGSMAQTYKGVVADASGHKIDIAARALKHGIEGRLRAETPRLAKLAQAIDTDPLLRSNHFPLMGPILDDVRAMATDELDMARSIQNQNRALKAYAGTLKTKSGVDVVFTVPRILPAQRNDVMFSEWVKGEKFDNFRKAHPAIAAEVAEATATRWLQVALFEGHFFHADMHQGNLKIQALAAGKVAVSLLDFGMVGEISKEERSVIGRLAMTPLAGNRPTQIAGYLWRLSDENMNTISYDELVIAVEKYLAQYKPSVDEWLSFALSIGIKLPRNITAFSRGIGAVEQLLEASGSKRELSDLVKEVATGNKLQLASDVTRFSGDAVTQTVMDGWNRFFGRSRTRTVNSCQALFAK